MTRVKRGYVARKRRNSILKFTAGSKRAHSRLIRPAIQQRMKALACAHRDRAKRKRDFRKLWIVRLNAALRKYNLNYSQFIHRIGTVKSILNRKMLAQLAILDQNFFVSIVNQVNNDFHTNQKNIIAGPFVE